MHHTVIITTTIIMVIVNEIGIILHLAQNWNSQVKSANSRLESTNNFASSHSSISQQLRARFTQTQLTQLLSILKFSFFPSVRPLHNQRYNTAQTLPNHACQLNQAIFSNNNDRGGGSKNDMFSRRLKNLECDCNYTL